MSRVKPPAGAGDGAQRVATFLRSLAAQAEGDPTLAASSRPRCKRAASCPPPKTVKAPRAPKRPADAAAAAAAASPTIPAPTPRSIPSPSIATAAKRRCGPPSPSKTWRPARADPRPPPRPRAHLRALDRA